MTNNTSVIISALPQYTQNLPAFALMMERQRRFTLKLEVIDLLNHSEKKDTHEYKKKRWETSATQFPKL